MIVMFLLFASVRILKLNSMPAHPPMCRHFFCCKVLIFFNTQILLFLNYLKSNNNTPKNKSPHQPAYRTSRLSLIGVQENKYFFLLLQQNHFLSFNKRLCFYSVEIYSARYSTCIKFYFITSHFHFSIYQDSYFIT